MLSLQVHIRRPFGAPAQNVGSNKRVFLISGGTGSTRLIAISKFLPHSATIVPKHARGMLGFSAAVSIHQSRGERRAHSQ